jgi:DNA-binding NarL/FixJ family response regulator
MSTFVTSAGLGRTSITVLIADASPLARAGVAHILAEAGGFEVIGAAGTPAETVSSVAALRPDVVSIGAGVGDGLELARRLRDEFEDLGIVVVTADGADDVLLRALDSGASAFVETSAPLPEYLGALRHAAVAANAFCAQGLAAAVRRYLTPAGPSAASTLLSPRERQLLNLLQSGCSVPAAAAALFVSVSTAKTYVARIYDKLGVDNRGQALLAAERLGLLEGALTPA